MKKLFVMFCATAILGSLAGSAFAEWSPNRPIELIAPAGPGGGWDLLCRTMQKTLQEEKLVDRPVLVTNKPGGGGAAGWNYLKGKEGKGEYIAATSTLLMLNNLFGKSPLTYKDFTVLANLQTEWISVAVAKDAPWTNGKELFEAIAADPNGMVVGVGPSLGNNDHISFLMLAQKYGVDPKLIKFVVYPKTAAEQIPALMGGHVKAITIGLAEVMEQHKAGNLRVLGISSNKRLESLPDVTPWVEQGADMVFPHWRGIIAAPGLSEEQVAYWQGTIEKMIETPTWKDQLKKLEWESYYQDPVQFATTLAEQTEAFQSTLKEVGLID
ncbi:tripartite tricarboxylate transporter substrate binding protein [Dethiosulfovibrio salsuginis]|uniref:Tripartite-type tricarboxylate transporter, receptor component TctC n=1 Tax=Dethiosulfovibrio salsuginis TaxID=561720 RepID=A0A1X7JTW7_9BACT|nr:tripartite tricarboxylate transporter substrate binding protein [Dethiosulfovibrio salsuginis]SMG31822.1 Tripartite-type tricarboxylate transporter, receptor component TctC [Dethiosulfovibrio salsuginis]